MARVLVTGAAGFIGSHLVDRLLADGHEVIGLDALYPTSGCTIGDANLRHLHRHPRFRLLVQDVRALDLQAVGPVGAVMHLAGQPGVRSSWGAGFGRYVEYNIEATQHLLEQFKGTARPPKLVFASTSSVYGDVPLPMTEDGPTRPISPYGVTKLAAEHLCGAYGRQFGVPWVALRLFTVYGPRQRPDMAFHRFFRALQAGQPLTLYGAAQTVRDFTYVDDAVEAFVLAMERPVTGELINVGGGVPTTLRTALELLQQVAGRTARVIVGARREGDAAATAADLTRAHRVLDFRPRVGLADGLSRQWEWMRQGGTAGPAGC